jgi:branched-chain amino acid transport system permease protein
LLWTYYGLTPWIGIPLGIALSMLLAVVIGYPCFRLRVVGHYFALVTLALSQVVLLSLVAARDVTGGSLGFTQRAVGHSWYALQFPEKSYFYGISIVVWLVGLYVWQHIDRGINREALEAISEDEDAAAAIGINVLREKLRVTVISAALTALGGADLCAVHDVHQSRDGLGHCRVAADCFCRHRRRGLFDAGPDGWLAADAFVDRRVARLVRHQFHRCREYDLRHPSYSVHHLHAARHRRCLKGPEVVVAANESGGSGRMNAIRVKA